MIVLEGACQRDLETPDRVESTLKIQILEYRYNQIKIKKRNKKLN